MLGIPDKHGQLSLHLPVGDSINVQNYLLNDSDTALRADCPLSSLSSYATTSDDPFIIKRFILKESSKKRKFDSEE